MKKILSSLAMINALVLTGCSGYKQIERDEFFEMAKQVKEVKHSQAIIHCKGKIETLYENRNDKDSIDKIDKKFYYTFITKWKSDVERNGDDLSELEKEMLDSGKELLTKNIKTMIKLAPLKNETAKGLTFYKNPFSFVYRVIYVDAKTNVGVEDYNITMVLNGPETVTYEFDEEEGRVKRYSINSNISEQLKYQSYSMTFTKTIKMNYRITYNDVK